MDNELMDYTAQKNFDFFTYKFEPREITKRDFISDCQKVLEGAHATFLDTLKLGVRLAELKQKGTWEDVINPKDGERFYYSSFEEFSKYAFGFGKTRTSNLLSLAKFVQIDEGTGDIVYKHPRYVGMNMSQLVELAPLDEWQRKYFSADLSVADMRMCKRYANSGAFYNEKDKENFDLLSSAREWTENLAKRQEEEEEKKVNAEVQSEIDRVRELAHAAGLPFSEKPFDPDEDFNPYVFDGSMSVEDYELMHELMQADKAQNSDVGTEGERKYVFSSHSAVRKFLADFKNWEAFGGNEFFDDVYGYRFKNGMVLYAATCKTCVTASDLEEKGVLFFFLHVGNGKPPIKIAKAKLAIWLRANERDLL